MSSVTIGGQRRIPQCSRTRAIALLVIAASAIMSLSYGADSGGDTLLRNNVFAFGIGPSEVGLVGARYTRYLDPLPLGVGVGSDLLGVGIVPHVQWLFWRPLETIHLYAGLSLAFTPWGTLILGPGSLLAMPSAGVQFRKARGQGRSFYALLGGAGLFHIAGDTEGAPPNGLPVPSIQFGFAF